HNKQQKSTDRRLLNQEKQLKLGAWSRRKQTLSSIQLMLEELNDNPYLAECNQLKSSLHPTPGALNAL
ncbi:MAG: hypothetical protein IKN86_09730, partial [Bacteroidaceae bacterium]|nr:hypothetical protein [Bacteroidaceae bacterium]